MAAIEVEGLTKAYGEVLANDDLRFEVDEGEVFGYLGPNGAGKTTTLRTLMGLQTPTAGTATVLGSDVRDRRALREARRRIGYLPESPSFDEGVSGGEILDLHAAVKGDGRREELLELFGPPIDRPVGEYSTGNVRKLGLVQAFMHDPDLVIMDEPTSGLDPLAVRRFDDLLREEKRRGTTVLMSSHVLSEVRRVCDRVGILREGRLARTEAIGSLLRRSGKRVRLRVAGALDAGALDAAGVHDLDVHAAAEDGDESGFVWVGSRAETEATFTYTGDVNDLLDRLAGYDLLDLEVTEAPLEEVFMRFYGGEE